MKSKICIVTIALMMLAGAAAPRAAGVTVVVDPLDRPYYIHGPRYYAGPHRYVWVPGHWNRWHNHWVHGHYRRI